MHWTHIQAFLYWSATVAERIRECNCTYHEWLSYLSHFNQATNFDNCIISHTHTHTDNSKFRSKEKKEKYTKLCKTIWNLTFVYTTHAYTRTHQLKENPNLNSTNFRLRCHKTHKKQLHLPIWKKNKIDWMWNLKFCGKFIGKMMENKFKRQLNELDYHSIIYSLLNHIYRNMQFRFHTIKRNDDFFFGWLFDQKHTKCHCQADVETDIGLAQSLHADCGRNECDAQHTINRIPFGIRL